MRKIQILLLTILTLLSAGCRDDILYDGELGEGEGNLNATVVFSPVLDALDNKATRASGSALKHINSLCVFIYGRDGRLIRRVPQNELIGYSVENNNKQMADDALGNGEHQAETNTPQATFTIEDIPFGYYYIYAVANMGNLSQYSDADLDTPDKLKEIRLVWDEDNISINDQMFGYFCPADAAHSNGFDAPAIAVNKGQVALKAWLKRAASKVTVAVDGSGLKDGVSVWIKSVQIKDIPADCWLGKDHVAAAHYLISNGEKTIVSTTEGAGGEAMVDNKQNWPIDMATAHTETAPAYYFYENMQGEGQSKHQAWTEGATDTQFPDGNSETSQGFKDSKANGTYMEVIGYYKSTNPEKPGEGRIVYRFMLGKDADKNYDAQRNYHYKLTLKLKNWANENDWHIVYDPDPEFPETRNPIFISYLYDESMMYSFPIRGHKLVYLKVRIPNDDVNKGSWHPIKSQVKPQDIPSPYWTGTPNNPGPWNGFLSLNKTKVVAFGTVNEDNLTGKNPNTYTNNQTYWAENSRGERIYNTTPGWHRDPVNGDYLIEYDGADQWMVHIPLYTRARVMTEQTGYTGNNPYVSYQREAQIKIIAKVQKAGEEAPRDSICRYQFVRQVRRIVNPKGIWRDANSTKPFHIQMKILPYESSEDFENLKSEGPWHAVIETGDWFDIIPTPGASQKNPDGSISGTGDPYDIENNPGCVIDFTFKPKGTTKTPRGGTIKIYYNNNTCVHRIYVRQGYEAARLHPGGPKWHTKNLVTATTETSDPKEEGSYFRLYNLDLPISASNNVDNNFKNMYSDKIFFDIATGGKRIWEQITPPKDKWGDFVINGKKCRMPTKEEYTAIIKNTNNTYGNGILYTDDATETASKKSDVYGGKGMRGLFICNSETGMNIFLPIGKSGYGRFKQYCKNGAYNRLPAGEGGVIQYANRYGPFPTTDPSGYGVSYKPLFWDIYRRPGALYWLSNELDPSITTHALDINYYTFMFEPLTIDNDLGLVWKNDPDESGSDAIQIRLVED